MGTGPRRPVETVTWSAVETVPSGAKTGRPVLEILRGKYPEARIPAEEDFDVYADKPYSIGIFIFEEDVAKQAAFCTGAAGPIGVNADALKAWLLRYGAHSEALRVEMAEWACVMANGSPCYGMYLALNDGRMLAANKEPGFACWPEANLLCASWRDVHSWARPRPSRGTRETMSI